MLWTFSLFNFFSFTSPLFYIAENPPRRRELWQGVHEDDSGADAHGQTLHHEPGPERVPGLLLHQPGVCHPSLRGTPEGSTGARRRDHDPDPKQPHLFHQGTHLEEKNSSQKLQHVVNKSSDRLLTHKRGGRENKTCRWLGLLGHLGLVSTWLKHQKHLSSVDHKECVCLPDVLLSISEWLYEHAVRSVRHTCLYRLQFGRKGNFLEPQPWFVSSCLNLYLVLSISRLPNWCKKKLQKNRACLCVTSCFMAQSFSFPPHGAVG